jgi:hypothetical protein
MRMKNTIAVLVMVGVLSMANIAYGAREDLSLTYLQMLPDESLKALFDWCAAHEGEPVSTNTIIDVPNYVSCDEVKLDHLTRGLESFADTMKQKLKDYCDGTLPPEEAQKLTTIGEPDCKEVNKTNK